MLMSAQGQIVSVDAEAFFVPPQRTIRVRIEIIKFIGRFVEGLRDVSK
jgi:hypothetical protein